MGSNRESFNALVSAYSLSPDWRFNSENVPMQPRKRSSRPIFHVTNSGLKFRIDYEWKHFGWCKNFTHKAEFVIPSRLASTWRSTIANSLCKTSKQKKHISGVATIFEFCPCCSFEEVLLAIFSLFSSCKIFFWLFLNEFTTF